MKRHLLYVACEQQIDEIKKHLTNLTARPVNSADNFGETFILKHKYLGKVEIELSLISSIDRLTPHLRLYPVDLLIYDERGEHGIDAVTAMERMRDDISALSDLWGPDFLFPMRRAVAILKSSQDASHRVLALGRDHVRDVYVEPKNLMTILKWIGKLLSEDLKTFDSKIGLALSGGGIEGFLYQAGALHALEAAIENKSMNDLDLYSGVSSGSIVTSLLASQVPTLEVVKAINGESGVMPPLKSSTIFDIAAKDIVKRIATQSLKWTGLDPNKVFQNVLKSIPTGLFLGNKIRDYFREAIEAFGHDDTFTSLANELYIGATDQDTFEHVIMGRPPWDEVPISEAVRASCALPPFFTPNKIKGRYFIDGQVTRTCNLELTVRKGCRLVLIVDPLKPYSMQEPGSVEKMGGIHSLIQTVKALVYTRFSSTLSHITDKYPDVDFMVFQPDEECAQLMAGSPMRYKIRRQIVDLAYEGTLRKLRERHHVYESKLHKFGLRLCSKKCLLELEREGIDLKDIVDEV